MNELPVLVIAGSLHEYHYHMPYMVSQFPKRTFRYVTGLDSFHGYRNFDYIELEQAYRRENYHELRDAINWQGGRKLEYV